MQKVRQFGTFLVGLVVIMGSLAQCDTSPQQQGAPQNESQQETDFLVLVEDKATGTFGYQKPSGEQVIAAGKYELCMTDTFRTHAMVVMPGQPNFVVIDRQEQVLYEVFMFDNGPDYPAEGLFRIVKDGKIGYADATTYAVVIEPQFDCAYPFENGRAKVSTDCQTSTDGEHSTWTSEHWTYIDRKG